MNTVRTRKESWMMPEWMTLAAAAEALGVSRFKVSRLIREGTLRAYVSPLDRRLRLVRTSDVEALKQELVPVEIETGKIAA